MISKELLSAVLGVKVDLVEYSENQKQVHYYCNRFGRATGHTNIHELAHMVKEWAECSYKVDGYNVKLKSFGKSCDIHTMNYSLEYILTYFTADTEPEAIFKAGEHVLEEISK